MIRQILHAVLFALMLGGAALGCRQGSPAKPLPPSETLRAHARQYDLGYQIGLEGTPGLRLVLEDGLPQFELKWADKPRYKQSGPNPVSFPIHRWVHIQIHLKLSDQTDGVNELWLDGRQIIQAHGPNLPLADTIYNHLEVGITANLQDATVFVDDVAVSDKPFRAEP